MKKSKKQTKKPKTKPAPTKAKAKAKPEETMDRAALKAVVSQLKDMGSDIKVFKTDTDDALQKKVNEAIQQIPKGDVLKRLESIVPDKLVTVLKRDCIGIFIDLSDVSCVRCKDSGTCVREFIKNLKGGLIDLQKALPDKAVEKVAAKVKLTPVTRYDADRLVFVRDVKNPNPKGHDLYDTLQAVLDEQPGTMSELREIVERDFDIDNDGDFMKTVTNMRDAADGVIKLDVDLSAKDKAALKEAGYDV